MNDALKAVKKVQRDLSLEEQTDDLATTRLAALLVDPDPQPEQWLEEKEMRERILSALKNLPPEQRAVVVMRYFLDMSEADMSARLERPFSTIKWWLRSARKSLRNLINVSR